MNKERLLAWWRSDVKWLSIMMGERVERRTVVKLCCLWVLLALLLFVPALHEAAINGWWVAALIVIGMLAYSAAIDLTETERRDKED